MPRKWNAHLTQHGRDTQECYDLPHRLDLVKVYPVKDPLGSTALIYAHEVGLTVVWRGALPLKNSISQNLDYQTNGTRRATNGTANGKNNSTGSEDIEEVGDADEPIVFHLDIHMSTAVLDFSFPVLPPTSPLQPENSIPIILQDFIVVVAACADLTLRILRIPLEPERVKAPDSTWDRVAIATILLPRAPNCVAVTCTPSLESSNEPGFDNVRVEDGSLEPLSIDVIDPQLDLLVAACTEGADGKLYITRVPLETEFNGESYKPFREQNLLRPANKISFNSSTYPSELHSHLLLSHPASLVSVYCPLVSSKSHGIWLNNFSTPFSTPKNLSKGVSIAKIQSKYSVEPNSIHRVG
jgi:hypothetical protein